MYSTGSFILFPPGRSALIVPGKGRPVQDLEAVFVGLDEQIEELVQFILAILPTHRKLARNTTAFLSQNAISNAVHSSASFIPVSSQLPLIDTIVKIPEVIFN